MREFVFNRFICWLALLSYFVPSTALASVEKSNRSVIGTSEANAARRLREDMGFDDPKGKRVIVCVTLGATSGRVFAIADPTVSPETLATPIDLWARESLHVSSPKTIWSKDQEESAVLLRWGDGEWGRMSASTTYDVHRLLTALVNTGLEVQAAIQVASTSSSSLTLEPDTTSRTVKYYRAERLGGEPVTVKLKIDQSTIWLVALFFFALPIVVLAAFVAAIRVGKSERIPVEQRRKFYSRIVTYPIFGGIALHAPFAMWFLLGGSLRSVSELWLGSTRTTTLAVPLLTFPVALIFICLPLFHRFERKLFGASAVAAISPDTRIEEITKRSFRATIPFLLGAIAIFTVFSFVPALSSVRFLGVVLGFGLIQFGSTIVARRTKKEVSEAIGTNADERVSEICRQVCSKMGLPVRKIEINNSSVGMAMIHASVSVASEISITRRAAEELSDSELEFLIAHEAAHVKLGHVRKKIIYVLLPALVFIFVPIGLMLGRIVPPGDTSMPLMFGAMTFSLLHVFATSKIFMRRFEFEADQMALHIARNLEAAISSLTKMVETSPMPGIHEVETASDHPAMSRRFTALKLEAARMKL